MSGDGEKAAESGGGKSGREISIPLPNKSGLALSALLLIAGILMGNAFGQRKTRDFARFVNAIYETQARQAAERIIKDARDEAAKISREAAEKAEAKK